MRVAFCAYDAPGFLSGPNNFLRRIVPELRTRGFEPQVILLTEEGLCPTQSCLERLGVECRARPRAVYTEDRVRWILEQAAELQPHVFVPNVVTAGYFAGRWLRDVGVPTIGVQRSDHPFYHALRDQFANRHSPYQLSALVAVSRTLADKARADALIPVERIPSGTPLPEQLATPAKDRFRLAYTGRLVDESKQVLKVCDAMLRLGLDDPKVCSVIMGEGPRRAEIEQVARENPHAGIEVTGALPAEDVQSRLLECHLLLLLSDYEGLSVSLMEAMACGVVPICLRGCSGIDELVIHEETGLLVDDRGPSLDAAVARLQHDVKLWQQLSVAARAKIETEYGIGTTADRWAALLDRLADGNAEPGVVQIPQRVHLPPLHSDMRGDDTRSPSWPVRLARNVWHRIRG